MRCVSGVRRRACFEFRLLLGFHFLIARLTIRLSSFSQDRRACRNPDGPAARFSSVDQSLGFLGPTS